MSLADHKPCNRTKWISWCRKTTYLTMYCTTKEGLKVAVIVNDMSEVNVDANLVKNENILSRTEENWSR